LPQPSGLRSFFAAAASLVEVPLDALCEAASKDDIVGNQLAVRAFCVPGTTTRLRRASPPVRRRWLPTKSRVGREDHLLFARSSPPSTPYLCGDCVGAVAFVDGTFYTDDELISQHLLEKRAESLGHQSVAAKPDAAAAARRRYSRYLYAPHNSNPMLDPASAASRQVREAGAEMPATEWN